MFSKKNLRGLTLATVFAGLTAGTQAAHANWTPPITLQPDFQICVGKAISETFPNMIVKVGQDIKVDEYNDGTGFLKPHDKAAIVGQEKDIRIGTNDASYTLRIHTVTDEEFDQGPVTDIIVQTHKTEHGYEKLSKYKTGLYGSNLDGFNNSQLRLVEGVLNADEFRSLREPLEDKMAELGKAVRACAPSGP